MSTLLFLILITVGHSASGQAAPSRAGSSPATKSRVMVLRSYHQDYRWTDSISESVSLALADGTGPNRGSFYTPAIYESLFQYEELQQAGASKTALPKGSRVLGRPVPLPMSAILGILALTIIVLLEGLTLVLLVRNKRRLKDAEFNYRILSEHIPTVVYMVELGQPNRRSYISPKLRELFGWDEALWLRDQQAWNELIHPDDRERVLAAFEVADKKESPGFLEYRLKNPEGLFI